MKIQTQLRQAYDVKACARKLDILSASVTEFAKHINNQSNCNKLNTQKHIDVYIII